MYTGICLTVAKLADSFLNKYVFVCCLVSLFVCILKGGRGADPPPPSTQPPPPPDTPLSEIPGLSFDSPFPISSLVFLPCPLALSVVSYFFLTKQTLRDIKTQGLGN